MRHLEIDLSPEEYHEALLMKQVVARRVGVAVDEVDAVSVERRTLDCRRRNVVYHTRLSYRLAGDAPEVGEEWKPCYRDCGSAPRVVIVGAGPAGLFAALRALELGLKPIIVERGKAVEERKYDVARLARERVVDADSNWCFGEGGAGTYSDGKLYTRSTKRGDVGAVLRTFVAHGADPDIMLDAHAHIGTDRLSGIIANMRRTIVAYGGEYHFGTRMVDLKTRDDEVLGIVDQHGNLIEGVAVVLATGHSARDVYGLFHRRGWLLEAKPFAMGVRVEHPQALINEIQYHGRGYSRYLPPAAYSLTAQAEGHGVFSFCMCPGGVIVPAATGPEEQVVNGMSNSRRNSPFANSGIAVTVDLRDIGAEDELALLRFQQDVEHRAFVAGGAAICAPSQRMTDFLCNRASSQPLPRSGYLGSTVDAPLHQLLPPFVVEALRSGLKQFDRKMRGFITEDALLLAVESRTSSPVRIPRLKDALHHPQLKNLYPCGEGAGYAGGIVSSALDGIRCIENIAVGAQE